MVVLAFYALAVGAQTSSAPLPTVAQILARSKKLYESCHSYQGTLSFTVTQAGKPYTQTIKIKCELGPKGIVKRTAVNISSDNTPAGAGPMNVRAIDDGANAYTIDDAGKTFTKHIHSEESIFAMLSFMNDASDSSGAKVSLGGTKLDPVYVIARKSPEATMVLRISEQTGQFLEMRGTRSGSGSGAPDSMKVSLDHQIFNAAIPAEAFAWIPPKEYKETKDGG